jgi:hypothetical protein
MKIIILIAIAVAIFVWYDKNLSVEGDSVQMITTTTAWGRQWRRGT